MSVDLEDFKMSG